MSNFKTYAAALAAIAVIMPSCSEKDVAGPAEPLSEGMEIHFGANLDPNSSRTYYGAETTEGSNTVWPIYWNYPDNLDQIFIYSPQAIAGRNQAVFTVHPDGKDMSEAAQIVKVGATGIQTSDNTTEYDFFALYPAKYVTNSTTSPATASTISGSMPFTQRVKYSGTALPTTATEGNDYTFTPDMANCLMSGYGHATITATQNSATVDFSPFSSVIDLTINGYSTNSSTTPDPKTITSVRIEADKPITGDFSVEFSSDGTPTFKAGENASNYVTIYFDDADGNQAGIPLTRNNTINLQAFILPNPEVTSLSVTLITETAESFTKSLELVSTAFRPRQIHKVKLPYITGQFQLDYEVWLSQLDPRTYISEISLPGSVMSFNSQLNGIPTTDAANTQTLTIEDQFKAGVRVFQTHINQDLNIVTSTGIVAKKDGTTTPLSLGDVLDILSEQMTTLHSDEFCVLMLSDNISASTPADLTAALGDFYKNLAGVLGNYTSILADRVDENTTIGDVRGKVIVKIQLNGDSGVTGKESDTGTPLPVPNFMQRINTWTGVDGTPALFNWYSKNATIALWYAPMAWGSTGTANELSTWSNILSGSQPEPTFTQGTGLVGNAGKRLYDSSTWSTSATATSSYWSKVGNIDCTTRPTDISTGMWYIYAEQANPVNVDMQSNMRNIQTAIHSDYNSSVHNKIFMSYCGGVGTGTLGPDYWINLYETQGIGYEEMPYGWVLLNKVVIPTAVNTTASSSDYDVSAYAIKKIINHNTAISLARK